MTFQIVNILGPGNIFLWLNTIDFGSSLLQVETWLYHLDKSLNCASLSTSTNLGGDMMIKRANICKVS